MKRSFFVLFLASIIVFSCKKSNVECEIMAPSDSVIIPIPVSTRSLDDAKNWAQRSISLIEGHNTKSCRAVRKIESCETITKNITKSDGSIPDTLMYVFNFADSLGFSIIAADPNIKPILAVTESGNYDGESSGNEAFDDYMEALKEKLGDRLGGHGHELYYWYDYVMVGEIVNKNVGVRWGQGGIYGAYCPNGISGCFATAMAQIMAYHQSPSSFYTTINMGNDFLSGESVSLNWSHIREHQVTHADSLGCTLYHTNIGAFLREIGDRINMDYRFNPAESYAYVSDVPSGFSYFGYNTSSPVTFTINSAKSAIMSFGPVFMYGGFYDIDNNYHGHAWVLDEYKDYMYYYCKFELAEAGSYTPIITQQTLVSEEHVFHVNWGWNGDCNGYFSLGVFDVDYAESYDYSNYTHGRNYNTNLKIIIVY